MRAIKIREWVAYCKDLSVVAILNCEELNELLDSVESIHGICICNELDNITGGYPVFIQVRDFDGCRVLEKIDRSSYFVMFEVVASGKAFGREEEIVSECGRFKQIGEFMDITKHLNSSSCPICKCPGDDLVFSFYCTNHGCQNYKG